MDGGFFYLLLQISRPGAALVFPTRLDSVPGWAESWWEICWSPTSRRNAPLRGSQRRHNHVSCFLLLLMLFIFGRKLILDSRKGSIICPTRRGWPPTLIDTVRRRLRFMGAICAG